MTKPTTTIRDGRLSASIWANTNAGGDVFHSVTFERLYADGEGKLHNSTSFSGTELLRIAELARLAYHRIGELRAQAASNSERATAH